MFKHLNMWILQIQKVALTKNLNTEATVHILIPCQCVNHPLLHHIANLIVRHAEQ